MLIQGQRLGVFLAESGIGPETRAPVRFAVSVIFSADWSMIRWS